MNSRVGAASVRGEQWRWLLYVAMAFAGALLTFVGARAQQIILMRQRGMRMRAADTANDFIVAHCLGLDGLRNHFGGPARANNQSAPTKA